MGKSSKKDSKKEAKKESKESKKVAAVKPEAEAPAAEISYETRVAAVAPLAQPLASQVLTRRVLKTVKRCTKARSVKRGLKEVVKHLRKQSSATPAQIKANPWLARGCGGMVVLAGDISPVDVMTHVPLLCEEADVPYIYVPSKEELGLSGNTKRPSSCMMVFPTAGAVGKKKAAKADAKKSKKDEIKAGEAIDGYKETFEEVKALQGVFTTV